MNIYDKIRYSATTQKFLKSINWKRLAFAVLLDVAVILFVFGAGYLTGRWASRIFAEVYVVKHCNSLLAEEHAPYFFRYDGYNITLTYLPPNLQRSRQRWEKKVDRRMMYAKSPKPLF
jgi:prolipoprotein diacylglyceryltransferase